MLFDIDVDHLVGGGLFIATILVVGILVFEEARRIRKEERASRAEQEHIDEVIQNWITYDEHLSQHSPLKPERSCAHCYVALCERPR